MFVQKLLSAPLAPMFNVGSGRALPEAQVARGHCVVGKARAGWVKVSAQGPQTPPGGTSNSAMNRVLNNTYNIGARSKTGGGQAEMEETGGRGGSRG